jgi:hypothetical protein
MVKKIDNFDRHFFLYAKHRYAETNRGKDLRKLWGKRVAWVGIDWKDGLISVLLEYVWPLIKSNHAFEQFMHRIDPRDWRWSPPFDKKTSIPEYRDRLLDAILMVFVLSSRVDCEFVLGCALGRPDPDTGLWIKLKKYGRPPMSHCPPRIGAI